MDEKPRVVALIPARSGSKRVPGKNVRPLAGHPLIAYTIAAATDSGLFDAVVVSTDSPDYARIAEHYGADVPELRPAEIAGDRSPDIEWVAHTLSLLASRERTYDCFSLLRPTSPFRLPETLQRAWSVRFGSSPVPCFITCGSIGRLPQAMVGEISPARARTRMFPDRVAVS